MNLKELKVARVRRDVKAREIAKALGKTIDSYSKRENGHVKVTLADAFIITNTLHLTLTEFITIFFDGRLPFCTDTEQNYKFNHFELPLKEARQRAGLSKMQVADKLGVPISVYHARERMCVPATLDECKKLSKMFNLSLPEFNDIFFRSNLPFRNSDLTSCIITEEGGVINA